MDANLENCRAQIDAIDARIQALLQERTTIVETVGRLKARGDGPVFMRPGREAQIIRCLYARHAGAMDFSVVFRLWREMMMASLQIEQAFAVAVLRDEGMATFCLARDHFGGATPLAVVETVAALLEAPALLKVVPIAARTAAGQAWWQDARVGQEDMRVSFVLPFIGNAGPRAVVIGAATSEPTGDDWHLCRVSAAQRAQALVLDQADDGHVLVAVRQPVGESIGLVAVPLRGS